MSPKRPQEPEIYPEQPIDRTPFGERPSYCKMMCSVCDRKTPHKREGDDADFFCTEPHGNDVPKWMGNKVDMSASINDGIGEEPSGDWCGVPSQAHVQRKSLAEKLRDEKRFPHVQRTPGPVVLKTSHHEPSNPLSAFAVGYREGLKQALALITEELELPLPDNPEKARTKSG